MAPVVSSSEQMQLGWEEQRGPRSHPPSKRWFFLDVGVGPSDGQIQAEATSPVKWRGGGLGEGRLGSLRLAGHWVLGSYCDEMKVLLPHWQDQDLCPCSPLTTDPGPFHWTKRAQPRLGSLIHPLVPHSYTLTCSTPRAPHGQSSGPGRQPGSTRGSCSQEP